MSLEWDLTTSTSLLRSNLRPSTLSSLLELRRKTGERESRGVVVEVVVVALLLSLEGWLGRESRFPIVFEGCGAGASLTRHSMSSPVL